MSTSKDLNRFIKIGKLGKLYQIVTKSKKWNQLEDLGI